jgi:hypothetical protein
MAKLLKSGGNVLLLDEPTNDLDVETLRALEDALEDFAGCAVIISPRPVLPRPALHAYPRLRGRGACGMVRGQLRGLRGRQEAAPGAGRAGAEAGEVQEVCAVRTGQTITRDMDWDGGDLMLTARVEFWANMAPRNCAGANFNAKNPCQKSRFPPYPPCDRYRTRYPVSSTRTSASICYTDATPPQSRGRTPD